MAEIYVGEFEARLNSVHGGAEVRDIIEFLRQAAEQAGPVVWRAHLAKSGGWGIAGKRQKRVFCQFDPKPTVAHVCVQIGGASEDELSPAGTVHKRKTGKPWVDISDLPGAKVLEPLIFRAYSEAGVTLGARVKVDRARVREAASPVALGVQAAQRPTTLVADEPTVQRELESRDFVRAGVICSVDSGIGCRFEPKPVEFQGPVVYGLVVGEVFKKSGDTGRKNATLRSRMDGCANTINQILSGHLVGPFTENFKRLAPKSIEAKHVIEVWARAASADECRRLQRELNKKYDTIRSGWANRLE